MHTIALFILIQLMIRTNIVINAEWAKLIGNYLSFCSFILNFVERIKTWNQ